MDPKIWYCLCLLFSFYSLKSLVDDFYSINYMIVEKEDELYETTTNFMICSPLEKIKAKNRLNFSTKETKLRTKVFLNYTKSSIEDYLGKKDFFKPNESYIHDDQFCFLVDKAKLENSSSISKYLQNYYLFLYFFSNERRPFHYDYALGKNDFENSIYLRVTKHKVYGKEYLEKKCFHFKDPYPSSVFYCLNKCLMEENELNLGFYEYNDKGDFDLKLINNQTTESVNIENLEKILESKFSFCLNKCPKNDCFTEIFEIMQIKEYYYKNILLKEKFDKIDFYTKIYKAFYSTDDFWLQWFGLIALFLNTSVFYLLPFLVILLAKKLKILNHKYFILIFPKFKIFLVILILIFIIIQSLLMVKEYDSKSKYPNKTGNLNFQFESQPILLTICYPIENWTLNESKILKNSSFQQIELITENGNEKFIENKTLYYGFTGRELHWIKKSKVLFKTIILNNQSFLSRCFPAEIEFEKTRYKSMITFNRLIIYFKTKYFEVYLSRKDNPFTSETAYFKGEFYANIGVTKYSIYSKKSNCLDYKEAEILNCDNRYSCVDRCISTKYFEKYKNINTRSIIDKDHFTKDQWSTSFPNDEESSYNLIKNECFKLFDKVDCQKTFFYESSKTSYNYNPNRLTLNLNFEKRTTKELEESLFKLCLNIINLESIFFNNNATNLLLTAFLFLKKLLKFKWHRIYRYLIFLICLLGFITHMTMVFYGIIKGKLALTNN